MASTVSVMYVGSCPAVEVDPDGLGEVTVVLNQTIKVSPDMAAALLDQPANWVLPPAAPVPAAPQSKPASAAAVATKPANAEEA